MSLPVMFRLLFSNGIRTTELRKLERKDVDIKNRILNICRSKGHDQHYVALHDTMLDLMRKYDVSMELMRLKPHLTQDKIAEKSGFINAQSYPCTFKKTIGIPPREWLNRTIHIHNLLLDKNIVDLTNNSLFDKKIFLI